MPDDYSEALDCVLSFESAIQEIGRRVKAGEEPAPRTGYFVSMSELPGRSDLPGRVVVASNNETIVLTVYSGGQTIATEIRPIRAVERARLLLTAALPMIQAGDENR
jgi:hypothetical protein